MFDYLKALIIMMAFWSFCITLFAYYIPDAAKPFVSVYLDSGTDINGVGENINATLQDQINLPILDVGALVYYSSNFIVDLLINFIFALPQMITLLFNTLLVFAPMSLYLDSQIRLFIQSLFSVLYVLGLLAFLSNYRAEGVI